MLCPIKESMMVRKTGEVDGQPLHQVQPDCDEGKCALWVHRPNATDPDRRGACAHARQVEVLGGIAAQLEHLPARIEARLDRLLVRFLIEKGDG